MKNFINKEQINNLLSQQSTPDKQYIREILEQCKDINHKGLELEQVAALLQNQDPEIEQEIKATAQEIKKRIYGNRMVMFAPLYVSNTCQNSCTYCGFRCDNKDLKRKVLNHEEIKKEVEIIQSMGHKRLLMVWGETDYDPNWLVDQITAAYEVRTGKSGEIRRINVNLAPMDVENFKILKTANIGTYQCFQETYDKDVYEQVHVIGKKTDYLYRLYAMHRAMEAGIDDVGMGALYGLVNYKFENLALLQHVKQLETDMGVGPHTISFPRIEPAQGSEMSYNPPHVMNDEEMRRTVAIMRLAVPYTGMIISTRENAAMRNELLRLGISQLSGASKTYPGGYQLSKTNKEDEQQFAVGDGRSLDEIISYLIDDEYIPSFCTGCYRKGRTGEHFMGLAQTNFIKNYCSPNGIFTFAEYLRDYASPQTAEKGKSLMKKLVAELKNPDHAEQSLCQIWDGKNDVYI